MYKTKISAQKICFNNFCAKKALYKMMVKLIPPLRFFSSKIRGKKKRGGRDDMRDKGVSKIKKIDTKE
jgi:hypothetical protein